MKKLLFVILATAISASSAFASDSATNNANINDYDTNHFPGHWRPGHPYPVNPYPGYPHHNRRVICYARNGRGMLFEGVAEYRERAERWAMDSCYNYPSRQCAPAGCRDTW